jgi:hypothetical protein
VERELILRNVVCAAPISPSVFGIEAFAERLKMGAPDDQVIVGDLALNEWEHARLQLTPENAQLGFKKHADADFVRGAVAEFLSRRDELRPEAAIGFNAGLLLTLGEGDPDPSKKVVNANTIVTALGAKGGGRGGLTLVYNDDNSRWWIELSPQPAQEQEWTFDFNRHFADFPTAGEDRDSVIGWFAKVEGDLRERFETICSGADK